MQRPTKCRRVCYFPEVLEFSPTGAVSREPIVLTIKALQNDCLRLYVCPTGAADTEDLCQEAGFMLPQSANTKEFQSR